MLMSSPYHTLSQWISTLPPSSHTYLRHSWQSETAFSQHTLYSTTPLRHSWFPCSKWSCYHSPLSGMLTVPICPRKLVTLLIAHRITYKHTNALTLSLPPCTYLLPSHYIFPIPSTVYILLLLLEMPHPQFSNTQRSQCLINFISFLTIVSPTLLLHTSIHMHNFHLPQYDIHCVPNYHYHIHSALALSLSFTLLNFISSDLISSSTVIRTVPTATTITQTLALHHHTIPLSLNTLPIYASNI